MFAFSAMPIPVPVAGGAVAAIAAASFEPETELLLGRMTVQPSAPRASAINELIAGLKTDGIWAKLSGFYDVAAETEQQALLNWVRGVAGVNKGCTWTAGQGYKSILAGTAYVDLGFAPGAYLDSQNNLAFGCWTNTSGGNASSSLVQMGLISSLLIQCTANGNVFNENYRLNDTSSTTSRAGSGPGVGLGRLGNRTFVRPDAMNKRSYFNGLQNGSDITQNSTGIGTGNFCLFKAGGTINAWEDGVCFAYVGSKLTSSEVGNLHSRLAAYKTAAGIA